MSELKVNSIVDANSGNTAQINGFTPSISNMAGRNRIINGDMRIDQRNAGAAVTVSTLFPVDRFKVFNSSDGAFSAQQDSSAPTGFVNSLKFTTTAAATPLTGTQSCVLEQNIEGTNVSDLAWGSASAQTISISFWVRSSLTGTFGGALRNSANNRSYPFTYTISIADTWEYKTIAIVGDTGGTWLTGNGIGIRGVFGLGAGPDRSATAGVWDSTTSSSATGAVSVIGTLNATWQITGVQLEAGSVATPFERRPFGTELALCQRYYYRNTIGGSEMYGSGHCFSTTSFRLFTPFPTTMRSSPTAVEQTGTAADYRIQVSTTPTVCSSVPAFSSATEYGAQTNLTVASGLTTGNGGQARSASGVTSFLAWSAEL